MTDLPAPLADVDVVALASDVRRALASALAERGLDAASPQVRTAIVAALIDEPTDRKLSASERRRRAVALRYHGHSYDQIAAELGFANRGSAYRAVMKALSELDREPAEQLRQIAIERLEGVLAGGLYRKAKAGDLKSVDRLLKVMREERRYIPGLEVPVSAELTGAGGGAIVIELSVPEPVPSRPVPQAELGGLVLDVESVEMDVPRDASTAVDDDE